MELDPLLLSRIQFAFVVSFHAIFPVFTIGLASYIALLEGIAFRTGSAQWARLSQFWIKIFAVVFGMGVVSGLVMAFQFGTNWSEFSYRTSNFIGPTLSYEVVTAFFLEAAFLGVLLFGRNKVPPGLHLFSAIMVAVGTFISSFWILSTNSWMHTPAGYEMREGMVHVTSWAQAIFNPSFAYRFTHMAIASFLTGGFVVAGVSAYYLLRKHAVEPSRKALKMCLVMLFFLAPLQAYVGDLHGLNTLEYQPVKVAAMEGAWDTQRGLPLLLFAIPDARNETNHFEVGIPKLASLILTHDLDGEVQGLKDWPAEERPPVGIVFWAFRIMVGIGLLMIVVATIGVVQMLRGRLESSPRYLQVLRLMVPMPFIAVLAGWVVTEVGRQPWMMWGEITVADGLTPSLTGPMALFTLVGYMLVYAAVFTAGVYYLTRVVRKGMVIEVAHEEEDYARPKRPFSATDVELDVGDDPEPDAREPDYTPEREEGR
ncbi:cytochrome ubiquinol oxidase subunit I [Alkalisalibacterium limincola]|uniref:Cytochrome ubiquinol oxidase subunit I n=1 Tax=Alkalisalibacterium limincola TaxID=2699169 RepID=A0A5C8KPS9_9GAMM|nr:cytochrome ubiquinol oxidase subunit I [Alkalisalibacterium limincola]TXK62207.1 cytochrome ubiquinol oxidase subunit I [Alkalisalibacterium limincola]